MKLISKVKYFFNCLWIFVTLILFLCIPCSSFAATDSAQADFTAWSGYWWPSSSGGLATGIDYRGHPAPMEKYELLKDGAYPGSATQYELDHYYDPDAPSWYGQCHAWAAASVYEHIEFYPSSIENIIFYVGDKKGLLTACHQNDVSIRENAYPPEVFHWWLLHYIKDNGIDFYAELDPSVQVWNYPVFKYEMETQTNQDKIYVTCRIWYADDMVDPDIQGTVERTKIYTYTLYTSGDEITGGEWTGASVHDHPQQLILPLSPSTGNPYIDYNFIRNIATSKDDYLESNDPVDLNPGGYNLILLNEDVFTIPCDTGDIIFLSIEKIDDLEQGISFIITNMENTPVFSGAADMGEEIIVTADNPPYTITISRNDYGGGGVYRLEFDLKKRFEFANIKIQKGFGWGGFAITNTQETECHDIYVVGYTEDGSPIETYIGPFSLSPGDKRAVLLTDFSVRKGDRDDLYGVKILASSDLDVLSLSGYFERNMSCYFNKDGGSQLVIPDTSTRWDFYRFVSWGVYNPDTDDSVNQMRLFSSEGTLCDEASLLVPANQAIHYNNSNSPFYKSVDGGWILVQVENGTPLKGYVEWLLDGISEAEVLSPLTPGTDFFIPHVSKTAFWGMKINVINVTDGVNQVTFELINGSSVDEVQVLLNPREKRILDIEDIFPTVDLQTIDESAVWIHASLELAGYYVFETPYDDVFYPLLTSGDVMQELFVPHVASDHYWWTGLVLFNPFDEAVEFSILPYNADGHLMAEHTLDRTIQGKRKEVFTVSDLFGDQASGISFIKFKVSNGPGLAGVFGYGNADCSMLSGRVMR